MTKEEILKKAGKRIAMGRAIVRSKSPYISSVLYGLVFRPILDHPEVTLGVTKKLVCYYNPTWIVTDPDLDGPDGEEFMAGDIFHECWHILFGFSRIDALVRKGLERGLPEDSAKYLANVAGDISINNMARAAGYKLQDWVYYPEKLDIAPNQIMEKNWSDLLKDGALLSEYQEGATVGVCRGSCGGAGGHSAHPDLEARLDEEFGRHDADKTRIIQSAVSAMKDIEAKDPGSIPGFMETDFDFKKERSRIRWETKLRHVLTRCSGEVIAGEDDYCMSRPDRNTFMLGICLPGQIDEEAEVAFIRDTSLSMGEEELNTANNEIIHAMNAIGVSVVWFLDADTETKGKPLRVTTRDIPKLSVKGRGGTSFVQPLEAASNLRPRPDIIIYLTDGIGVAPPKPPRGIQVIWCLVQRHGTPRAPASWGHAVVCANKLE